MHTSAFWRVRITMKPNRHDRNITLHVKTRMLGLLCETWVDGWRSGNPGRMIETRQQAIGQTRCISTVVCTDLCFESCGSVDVDV
jgi:hypothetical protein